MYMIKYFVKSKFHSEIVFVEEYNTRLSVAYLSTVLCPLYIIRVWHFIIVREFNNIFCPLKATIYL